MDPPQHSNNNNTVTKTLPASRVNLFSKNVRVAQEPSMRRALGSVAGLQDNAALFLTESAVGTLYPGVGPQHCVVDTEGAASLHRLCHCRLHLPGPQRRSQQ